VNPVFFKRKKTSRGNSAAATIKERQMNTTKLIAELLAQQAAIPQAAAKAAALKDYPISPDARASQQQSADRQAAMYASQAASLALGNKIVTALRFDNYHVRTPERMIDIARAAELGAGFKSIEAIYQTVRLSHEETMVLHAARFWERDMSLCKRWCLTGASGDGEPVSGDEYYRVGPGIYRCYAKDTYGFDKVNVWTVKHVPVGSVVWTVAK